MAIAPTNALRNTNTHFYMEDGFWVMTFSPNISQVEYQLGRQFLIQLNDAILGEGESIIICGK